MMVLFGALPTTVKIIVWICIAHFWILMCSIFYVEMEGFKNHGHITNEVDLMLNTVLTTDKKLLKANKDKSYSDWKLQYQKKIKDMEYWKMRHKFNDISKVYVFVLVSHTTTGSSGMYLQTWQSQLFYILSMPIGVVMYYIMIHHIASQFFQILAYSAVTIYQRRHIGWTVDQRELYEKCKVFILAIIMLLLSSYIFAIFGVFSETYLEGLYNVLNITLTISSLPNFISFEDYDTRIIAMCMTFIMFAAMMMSYTVMYSLFIIFRYNNWEEIVEIFLGEPDELKDAATDDNMDYDEWKERRNSLIYLQARINSFNVQSQPQPDNMHGYAASDDSTSTMLSNENENKSKPKEQQHKSKKSYKNSPQLPTPKDSDYVPSIQVTRATPSPPLHYSIKKQQSALSDYSDITSISVNKK